MSDLIAALDNALAAHSEEVTLRLVVGSGATVANIDVKCRARVDVATTEQIVAGIPADHLNLILSPTQINNAQWPGGQIPPLAPPFNIDPRVPRENGPYKVIARGKIRSVAMCDPKYANNNELVRINLRVSG